MQRHKPYRDRLYETLMNLFTCPLSPDETRAAIEEFVAAARLEEAKARELEDSLPPIPRSFHEKWIGMFADEAVMVFSEERLSLMTQQSTKGNLLALAEYFGFVGQRSVEMRRDLKGIARQTGESADDLLLTLEALSTFAEQRIHEGKSCKGD